MSLEQELNKIWQEAERDFSLVSNLKELEDLKVKYLGRKSYLAHFPRFLKNLDLEEKRKLGSLYNQLKEKIKKLYEEKRKFFSKEEIKIDFEHPGIKFKIGKLHLLTQTIKEIQDIFIQLGFSIVDYPQIVSEKDNFDDLNLPPHHPARDMWATLWVKDHHILFRTHTTAFQVSVIKKYGLPLKAIIVGKVFRYEAVDKTHDFEFHQFDGISLSEKTHLGHLRFVVEEFVQRFFKEKVKVRFRPSYFPFVEPGLEIDISCVLCHQKGCSVCKRTGWLEIAGAGMIHSYVLKCAHVDPRKYQGYAFGFGLERLIMLKHNIDDIRILHSSDLRFIEQF